MIFKGLTPLINFENDKISTQPHRVHGTIQYHTVSDSYFIIYLIN